MTHAPEILEFWFGPAQAAGAGSFRQEWFVADPGFDAEIRSRFLNVYHEAQQGKLDHWQADAQGALSLVLIFDQFRAICSAVLHKCSPPTPRPSRFHAKPSKMRMTSNLSRSKECFLLTLYA